MRCPFCGNEDTQVKDSRPSEDGQSIRRRRFCPACDSRFTTFERIQLRELYVVKKNGQKRPFDRDKLTRSIRIAVRKRPVTEEQVEITVNNIVRDLEKLSDGEVDTDKIGERVMLELYKLDPVAYVRYASVYRDFRDIADFEAFIEQMEKEAKLKKK
jgi:transcriptional repressor NrdR